MSLRIVLFLCLFSFCLTDLTAQASLEPCPSSPNCVSTQALKKRKRMSPLAYSGDLEMAREKLLAIIGQFPGSTLEFEEPFLLHFTFTTKVGKFTDDVSFLFDGKNQVIHFRSASRKGWYDMRANKRRMKKISKAWQAG